MKKFVFFLFISFLISNSSWSQDTAIEKNVEVASALQLAETWINAQLEYNHLPGLSVGIVHDQELIWSHGFGVADVEKKLPMTPGTVFRIASITKLFTCTAIMQLRDQGKLRLDDPIEQFLPWFKIRHRYPDAPPITIRHIMTHTSGLPREAAFPYWTDHKFPTLEQIIDALPDQATIYPSETKWKYSNLGMALLGQIVESASGEKYEHYIQRRILAPLQMTSTSVNLTDDQKNRLATGYGRRLPDGKRKLMPFTDSKGITPAANMSSTVADLAKFAMLQFRDGAVAGEQILKGSTLREMQRVHWLQPSWNSGWGLGFSIWHRDNRTFFGHGGWVAGYRTQLLVSPAEKIAVIVMSNAEDGSPSFFANKIFDVVAPAIKKAVAPSAEVAESNPAWQNYLGKYSDPTDWEYEVMILNNRLILYGFDYPPEENPNSGIIELMPESEHTFRMTGENGDGELLIFELNLDGKVARIKKGENYIYPAASPEFHKVKSK